MTYTSKTALTALIFFSILTSLNPSLLRGKEIELIKSITIDKNYVKVRIADELKKKYLTEDFFVEYDKDIDLNRLDFEIATMPFLMNVIALIWVSGKTFTIDSMDEELYESLKTIKKMFKVLYPKTTWEGKLKPRKTVNLAAKFQELHRTHKKRAVLFSGGLDSTAAYFNHVHEDLVTITAWGAFDLPLEQSHIWKNRKQKIVNFTQKYGHTSSFLKSNYYDFLNLRVVNNISDEMYSWRLDAIEDLGWAGLAAPIMASKGCSVLSIPSSGNWNYPWAGCANPFIDATIQFGGFRIHHDQFELNRFGKNECIVNICKENGFSKPFIKVCQWTQEIDDVNCGNCRKCLPTILGFLALGENPADYGFTITATQAVNRTLTFLQKKGGLNHYDVSNFRTIQNRLRHQRENGGLCPDELIPFINYDLKKVYINDLDEVKPFVWESLGKIVPAIAVPKTYGEAISPFTKKESKNASSDSIKVSVLQEHSLHQTQLEAESNEITLLQWLKNSSGINYFS